jgi:hypothetical protein
MVSVCERFKEFVDFNAPISEDSVQETLDQVLNAFRIAGKKAREGEQSVKELAEIRTIVGVDKNISISRCVFDIVNECRQYQSIRQQIENDQREAAELVRQSRAAQDGEKTSREWEIWARRVHGLVTDSFTMTKSPRELQIALEETLLGALNQRQLKRKLEILRMEKTLLVRGLIKSHFPQRKYHSIASVICATACLHRLRKLSGHLPMKLSSFSRSSDRSLPLEKRFPVLNVV